MEEMTKNYARELQQLGVVVFAANQDKQVFAVAASITRASGQLS